MRLSEEGVRILKQRRDFYSNPTGTCFSRLLGTEEESNKIIDAMPD